MSGGMPVQDYQGGHHFNPFNKKQGSNRRSQHIEKISGSRRRWRHLYTKAFDALRGTGLLSDDPFALDWPSLSEPAILPLTMDYFPTPNELKRDYEITELYKLSLPDSDELEEMGYLSDADLVTELVCQRLAQEFQIITASDGAGEKLSGGLKYHLMYRHIIHKLTYDETSRNIEVTVYTHRQKKKVLDSARYYYPYTVLDLYDNAPHSVGQTFAWRVPIRWGYLDGVIVGYQDQYDKTVNYRRLHYLLIPPLDDVTKQDKAKEMILPWPDFVEKSNGALSSDSSVVMTPFPRGVDNVKTSNGDPARSAATTTIEAIEKEDKKEEEDPRVIIFNSLVETLSSKSIGDLEPMSVSIDTTKRWTRGDESPQHNQHGSPSTFVPIHSASSSSSSSSTTTSSSSSSSTTSSTTTTTIQGGGRRTKRMLVPQRTTKIRMKSHSSRDRSPQWIFVEYDKSFRTDRCYRITFQFLVCTGAAMSDFTTSFNRTCKKGNILMMQVPEYTHPWQNPYIHSFLVPLHLPMPLARHLDLVKIVEDSMIHRYGFVLEADVEWSVDAATATEPSRSSSTVLEGEESDRWAGKQYLHRTGGAFVRILCDGLLWIPNRMTATRNKWKDVQELFVVFRTFTGTLLECYEIVSSLVGAAVVISEKKRYEKIKTSRNITEEEYEQILISQNRADEAEKLFEGGK